MTRRFSLVAVLAVAAVLSLRATAQSPADTAAQQPTFRGGVDSVIVDVGVTDKQGHPVTDLTAADFEIRESGKPQKIDAFRLVQIDDGRDDASSARDILSLDDQQREAAREDNRLFVIFLDDYHVRLGNSVGIRDRLANWVESLSPHDLVAVMKPLLPASALTFSRDHDATAAEIEQFKGRKYNYTPMNELEQRYADEPAPLQEQHRNDWTIGSLRSICEYMETLRDGRKTLLFVSEGLSSVLPAGAQTMGAPNARGNPTQQPDPFSLQARAQALDSVNLLDDLQTVFGAASRSNTAIYTLDPRGLAPSEFSAADNVSQADDQAMLGTTTDSLRILAENTNGRAIVNRNNPTQDLRQMVTDNSTYYLLAYTSSLAPRDGAFHEIQVRVNRKDVQVRARKGYWAYTAADVVRANTTTAGPPPEIKSALDGLATTTEDGRRHPISTWLGAARGTSQLPRMTFVWSALADTTEPVDHVTVTATSSTGDVVFKGDVAREAQLTPASGVVGFDAPPGDLRVRVDVDNAAGHAFDSVETLFSVPDFSGGGARISTPLVFRGTTARDLQLIRAAQSPVPVTSRSFSRTERLLVRFSAYGPAGTVPKVTEQFLGRDGHKLADLPAPTMRAPGDFESEIGLGSVPPGDYLIEIAADSGGDTTKTLLAIHVTG